MNFKVGDVCVVCLMGNYYAPDIREMWDGLCEILILKDVFGRVVVQCLNGGAIHGQTTTVWPKDLVPYARHET
jgi:hypothetical protein